MNVKSKLSLTYAHGVSWMLQTISDEIVIVQETKESSNSNESFFPSMPSPGLYTLLIKILLHSPPSFSFLRIPFSPNTHTHTHSFFRRLYINWEVPKDYMWEKWIFLPIITLMLLAHYHLITPLWAQFHIHTTNAMAQGTRRSMHKKAAFHLPKHLKQTMMLCFTK